jgi:hypothetical protein
VNVLKSIEKRMEKMVEGLFGKAFKSSVQPVELAHKLAKEMGEHKNVGVSRVYVPNDFDVYLSPQDYDQLHSFEAALVEELASYLIAYARRENWTLVAKPRISLHADDDLDTGEFGIATRTASQEPVAAGAPASPPPQMSHTVVFQPPAAAPVVAVAPDPGEAAPAARTCGVVRFGSSIHELDAPVTVIGRSRQCDLVVVDPNVSRRHCEIRREGDDFVVIDLGSTNGVVVNGTETRRQALTEGDRIQLGTTQLRFERRPC